MKKTTTAFTVVEILVAFAILVVISGGVYSVLSSTRNVATLAQAKDEAKSMAEIIVKHLQNDIAISKAEIKKAQNTTGEPVVTPSLISDATGIKMMIPKNENSTAMSEDYVEVAYNLSGTKLYRKDGRNNTNRLLCSNVTRLDVFLLSADQVSVEVETSVKLKGMKEPAKHNQKVLVTIREAVANNVDNRWLTSEEAALQY